MIKRRLLLVSCLCCGLAAALAGRVHADGGTGAIADAIRGLFGGDVAVSSPTTNEVLTWQGGKWTNVASAASFDPATNGFRLSLASAAPVGTDVASSATIYLTPYRSNQIAIPDAAGAFACRSSAEIAYTMSGTACAAATNYDLFVWDNAGTVTWHVPVAWASDTARVATGALARVSGVWCLAADPRGRYVGTYRAVTATTTTDTSAQRFVWNAENRLDRTSLNTQVPHATWTQATNGLFTSVDGGAAWGRHEFVVGLSEDEVRAEVLLGWSTVTGNGTYAWAGVALDSTTTLDTHDAGGHVEVYTTNGSPKAFWRKTAPLGYHYLQALNATQIDRAVVFGNKDTNFKGTNGTAHTPNRFHFMFRG